MRGRWVCIGAVALVLLAGCNLKSKAPTVTLSAPTDGSGVAVLKDTKAVKLEWTAEDPNGKTLSFDVYAGTSAGSLTKQGTVADTAYTLSSLNPGSTYYWKVIASNGSESTDSGTQSFTVGSILSTVKVIEFTTGSMAAGLSASILLDDTEVLSGTTDSEGHFAAYLCDDTYEVKVSATGYATSVVYDYKPASISALEMVCKRAETDNDTIPALSVELLDSSGNTITSGTSITESTVKVHVSSDMLVDVLYLGLGFVPAATGRTAYAASVTDVTKTISVSGFTGQTVPLHIVAYTVNCTRVDQIVYLPISYSADALTTHAAPTSPWVIGWTSDTDVEYYSLVSKAQKALSGRISAEKLEKTKALASYAPDHDSAETNMFVQIAWTKPSTSTGLTGYNIYRKLGTDGDYEKVTYSTTYYCFDKGYDLEAGKTYYYKIAAVYSDGVESDGVVTDPVVPLDIWKVKLLSPADDATLVSRAPTFSWKPVVSTTSTETPSIGSPGVTNSSIAFVYYGPWIYDMANSDQHIFNDNYFGTYGPSQQSVAFLGGGGTWYHIDPDGDYTVQTDNLEKMKTYEWGLDLATAYYDFTNVTWISTTIDLGYGYDRWSGSNTADYYNRFTTGN